MTAPFVNPAFAGNHHSMCYAGQHPHPDDHEPRWSGWPGAFCLDCGMEDPDEGCMAGCDCPCHDEFWKGYEEYMRKQGESINEESHRPF